MQTHSKPHPVYWISHWLPVILAISITNLGPQKKETFFTIITKMVEMAPRFTHFGDKHGKLTQYLIATETTGAEVRNTLIPLKLFFICHILIEALKARQTLINHKYSNQFISNSVQLVFGCLAKYSLTWFLTLFDEIAGLQSENLQMLSNAASLQTMITTSMHTLVESR